MGMFESMFELFPNKDDTKREFGKKMDNGIRYMGYMTDSRNDVIDRLDKIEKMIKKLSKRIK